MNLRNQTTVPPAPAVCAEIALLFGLRGELPPCIYFTQQSVVVPAYVVYGDPMFNCIEILPEGS